MTATHGEQRFGPGVGPWRESLGKVRDAVRQELVSRQLAAHLPTVTGELRLSVADIGCGQGTQAIRLARLGYEVTGIDLSDELLDLARSAAGEEPDEVRSRLHFVRGDLLGGGGERSGSFDVVYCHGVLMYLPSLNEAIAAVVDAVRPGGVVSVLTRNRAGIAMRAGMNREWEQTLASFDARTYRNRLGIDEVRADDPAEVAALDSAGAERLCWYGVRLFSDHFGPVEVGADLAQLVAAEEQAGCRDPYRQLCALTHTLAVRAPAASQEVDTTPG